MSYPFTTRGVLVGAIHRVYNEVARAGAADQQVGDKIHGSSQMSRISERIAPAKFHGSLTRVHFTGGNS